MKILVTGATGFVGKKLIQRLKKGKSEVIATSEHGLKNEEVIGLDLRDLQDVQLFIKKVQPDIIFHIGAYVDLSRSYEASKKCIDNNIISTLNLLESLRLRKPQRLFFISTEEVYGNGPIPYKEEQVLCPPSGYAISKVAGEYYSKIYASELDFELMILRIGTMYGPNDRTHRLIPTIISKAVNGDDILLNSGEKARDYVYIDDVVDAFMKGFEQSVSERISTINIGGGTAYKLIDAVNFIVHELKSSSKVIVGAIPDRIGESNIWKMDLEKANKHLSWEPKTDLYEGLKKTIAFYKK